MASWPRLRGHDTLEFDLPQQGPSSEQRTSGPRRRVPEGVSLGFKALPFLGADGFARGRLGGVCLL